MVDPFFYWRIINELKLMIVFVFNPDVVKILDVVQVSAYLLQSSVGFVSEEVVYRNSIFKVEGERVDVIVKDQNVVKSESTSTSQDVEVFDGEDRCILIIIFVLRSTKLTRMLTEVSMLDQLTSWIKIVNNWIREPVLPCCENSDLEISIRKLQAFFCIRSN